MGISCDAILVYGIPLEEGFELETILDGHTHFWNYCENISGLPKIGEPGYFFPDQEKFRESYPVDIVTYCHRDNPMYIVAIRGTEVTARIGETAPVRFKGMTRAHYDGLVKWCEERGIEGEPDWYLCSYID